MHTEREHRELYAALAQNWGLASGAADALSDRSTILEALTERVRQLLRHDFQRLVTAMYTLDVEETRFQQALEGEESDSARQVAELILSREIVKIESRRKYAEEDSSGKVLPDGIQKKNQYE